MATSNTSQRQAQTQSQGVFDMSGLVFRIAKSQEDVLAVYACRGEAYGSKYDSNSPDEWIDEHDDRAYQYMCQNTETGETLGVMRMTCSRDGRLGIEDYIDLPLLINADNVVAYYNRFGVHPFAPRRDTIKLGLYTLIYKHSLRLGCTHQLLAVTQPLKPMYEFMLHSPYPGQPNSFRLDKFGSKEHFVMQLDLRAAPAMYKTRNHPFYEFIFEAKHDNICID
jgi:hypothetical protein